MNTENTNTDLSTASDDDLRALGLPPAFTMENLEEVLSKEEIRALSEGDNPVILPQTPDDVAEDAGAEQAEVPSGQEITAGETPVDPANDPEDSPAAAIEDDGIMLELRDAGEARQIIDGFRDQVKELRARYSDGDFTDDEYDEQVIKLTSQKIAAQTEIDRVEAHNTAQMDAWYTKTSSYMQQNPDFADQTPQPGLKGDSKYKVFDESLLFVTGDPRYAGLSMAAKIDTAGKIARACLEQNGVQTGKATADMADAGKDDTSMAEPGPGREKRPAPVQTLANVSAATDNEIENSRFAAIDKAEALEAEQMLSRMSEDERNAYLAGR